jgi:bifunctional ADP-heptose synthase (sugar kinase/adenylyltransferase)
VSKHRVVCDEAVTARFDPNAEGRWCEAARLQLARGIREEIRSTDLLLLGDYGTGTLHEEARDAVAAVRQRLVRPLVVDGHRFAEWSVCRPCRVSAMSKPRDRKPRGMPSPPGPRR